MKRLLQKFVKKNKSIEYSSLVLDVLIDALGTEDMPFAKEAVAQVAYENKRTYYKIIDAINNRYFGIFYHIAIISVAGCSTTSQSSGNTQTSSTAEVKIKPLDEATVKNQESY